MDSIDIETCSGLTMRLQGPRAVYDYNALFSPKSLWRFAMKVGNVMTVGAATVRPDVS